jgi:hypothetical protein
MIYIYIYAIASFWPGKQHEFEALQFNMEEFPINGSRLETIGRYWNLKISWLPSGKRLHNELENHHYIHY